MEPIIIATIAIVIIIVLYLYLTNREAEAIGSLNLELKNREETIAKANEMIKEYEQKVAVTTADKELADKMVAEYKINVSKSVNEKLAADQLAADRKVIADKAIADLNRANAIAADYKVKMEAAIAAKTISDNMVIEYKNIIDKVNAAKAVAEQAVADLKNAANAAALKAIPFGLSRHTTKNKAFTGTSSYNLADHPLGCKDGSINRIKLSSDGVNAKYEYNCVYGGNIGPKVSMETPFDIASGGNAVFLDRHGVYCPTSHVMTDMQYIKKPDADQLQYKYSCAKANALTCRDISTPAQTNGSGNFVFLDRHDIACNSDEALSGFRLGRPSATEINYNYRCCKV